ncbi:triose-phosphate isomerase [Ornithinibacillus gellani]|nr:triose-phosphate isomerase [Ornithinibacillus gellani]
MRNIKAPFFVVNPKSFMYGNALQDLALEADRLAETYDIDILFTAPIAELAGIVSTCPNLMVTSQHMDDTNPGDSMGRVFAESLSHIGVQAVVLNHADHPMSFASLARTVRRAYENNLQTIVCADSVAEAKAAALLDPTIVLAEPTALIGQEQMSDRKYVTSTIEAIKTVNPNVLVEQGAGIRSAADVEELLQLGADGVGVTSGIVKADNPIQMMENMVKATAAFKHDRR